MPRRKDCSPQKVTEQPEESSISGSSGENIANPVDNTSNAQADNSTVPAEPSESSNTAPNPGKSLSFRGYGSDISDTPQEIFLVDVFFCLWFISNFVLFRTVRLGRRGWPSYWWKSRQCDRDCSAVTFWNPRRRLIFLLGDMAQGRGRYASGKGGYGSRDTPQTVKKCYWHLYPQSWCVVSVTWICCPWNTWLREWYILIEVFH